MLGNTQKDEDLYYRSGVMEKGVWTICNRSGEEAQNTCQIFINRLVACEYDPQMMTCEMTNQQFIGRY